LLAGRAVCDACRRAIPVRIAVIGLAAQLFGVDVWSRKQPDDSNVHIIEYEP
jgi:hypothetical protein